MRLNEISVVILSGGKSSRMGRDKALLELKGRRFVDRIADQFNEADEILFSVKDRSDFPDIRYPHIADDFPGCGPLAGIHSALKHARNPWVFVIACDTPFIRKETVNQLLGYIRNDVDFVIPKEEDGRLHVLAGLYHQRILPVLEKQLKEGNYRVRQLLSYGKAEYVCCENLEGKAAVFQNVNTLQDYEGVNT